MNHLKWMGHSATILDIHKNLRADLQSCEVTLVAKGQCVKAHRFVLSSCSDLLRGLLSDIPLGQDCCIMVPDIKGNLLEVVLAFIYLGECSLSSSNLSEFLEAINILGIKSAISFECNTNAMQVAQQQSQTAASVSQAPASTVVGSAVRSVSTAPTQSVQLAQEELLESTAVLHSDAQPEPTSTVVAPASESGRELEFLDVYQEPQHKITYSIEHVPGSASANEFILTENSGTFTLTHHSHKLESASSTESTNMEVTEDESHIIEEYSSGDEPLMQLSDVRSEREAAGVPSTVQGSRMATNSPHATSIIEIKPKIKSIRMKSRTPTSATAIVTKLELGADDPMDMLHSSSPDESYTLMKESSANDSLGNINNESGEFAHNSGDLAAADMAYQAMLNEGLPLPKAAVKYNVSKSELWSRVRRSGVETLHKPAKLDPEKLDIIELASQAVISEGLSLQKAAVRYDISKTVLWRRVRKHPQYMKTTRENPIIAKAYERLKSGESLKSISQDLDIPMSTLHRHKVRLSQTGQLPDFVTCKKRDSFSKDDLKVKLAKAVHACVHDGMSQNHAANLFEISKSTLWRHLQKRVAEAEAAEKIDGVAEESMGEEHIKEEVILS